MAAAFFQSLEDKVANCLQSTPQFKQTASELFMLFEGDNDRVSTADCGRTVELVFARMQERTTSIGLTITKPSAEEVRTMLQEAAPGAKSLDQQQFEAFFLRVIKAAAANGGSAFAHKYGAGIVAGTMAVMVLKRTLRALPLVGLIAGPLLALAPTILVGPVLGMAVVYGLEKGDMTALHSRLFGQGGAPSGAAPAANPSRGSR